MLLQAGLMSRLAECTFLDQRPEQERTAGLMSSGLYAHDQDTSHMMLDSFVPTVVERYRQLLMPALKVSLAMLTSLGSQANKEVASKVRNKFSCSRGRLTTQGRLISYIFQKYE